MTMDAPAGDTVLPMHAVRRTDRTTISPGPIGDTEGMKRLGGDPAREQQIKGRLALRDYGTKQDVAEAALWLSSPEAKYVTGTILNVDGGSDLGDAGGNALG